MKDFGAQTFVLEATNWSNGLRRRTCKDSLFPLLFSVCLSLSLSVSLSLSLSKHISVDLYLDKEEIDREIYNGKLALNGLVQGTM